MSEKNIRDIKTLLPDFDGRIAKMKAEHLPFGNNQIANELRVLYSVVDKIVKDIYSISDKGDENENSDKK